MTEDELAAAYRARMQQGALPPDAPDPAEIQRVAAGKATEAERLRVLDAVMRSESLRREFDLFRALASLEPPPRVFRVPRQLLALAAGMLLVVMAGSLWWQRQSGRSEPTRGGAAGVSLLTPAPDAPVPAPVALGWATVPGATSYAVEVLSSDGSLLFQAAGRDTLVVLPDSLPIRPGESYVWRVVATLPDGRRVESEPRRFSAAP